MADSSRRARKRFTSSGSSGLPLPSVAVLGEDLQRLAAVRLGAIDRLGDPPATDMCAPIRSIDPSVADRLRDVQLSHPAPIETA
jgi:hypothetical protein